VINRLKTNYYDIVMVGGSIPLSVPC